MTHFKAFGMINLHCEIIVCQKIYNRVAKTVYVKCVVWLKVNKTLQSYRHPTESWHTPFIIYNKKLPFNHFDKCIFWNKWLWLSLSETKLLFQTICKVEKTSISFLVAGRPSFCKLFMIWKFDVHLLWNLNLFPKYKYRKVASSSLSWLVKHFQIFRKLMKGKFDA